MLYDKYLKGKSVYFSIIPEKNYYLDDDHLLIDYGKLEEIMKENLDEFEYIGSIPEIINSDLIYERPDIKEIEEKLKSAKIDIRVAKKEFLPSFNITGFLAFDTAGGGNFFSWDSSFAYLVAGLTQDILKGGEKIANLRIKKARFMELLEEYKQKDLNAIKEINNSLNLIKQDKLIEKNSYSEVELGYYLSK